MGDRIAVMNDGRLEQVGTPEELYERPANRFVAGFIGSPAMSFARGRRGRRPAAAGASGCRPAGAARRRVVLGVRPEHARPVARRRGPRRARSRAPWTTSRRSAARRSSASTRPATRGSWSASRAARASSPATRSLRPRARGRALLRRARAARPAAGGARPVTGAEVLLAEIAEQPAVWRGCAATRRSPAGRPARRRAAAARPAGRPRHLRQRGDVRRLRALAAGAAGPRARLDLPAGLLRRPPGGPRRPGDRVLAVGRDARRGRLAARRGARRAR